MKYLTVAFTPRVVLYEQTQFFTGLRFEVEQASRGLSAIAEQLVSLNKSKARQTRGRLL